MDPDLQAPLRTLDRFEELVAAASHGLARSRAERAVRARKLVGSALSHAEDGRWDYAAQDLDAARMLVSRSRRVYGAVDAAWRFADRMVDRTTFPIGPGQWRAYDPRVEVLWQRTVDVLARHGQDARDLSIPLRRLRRAGAAGAARYAVVDDIYRRLGWPRPGVEAPAVDHIARLLAGAEARVVDTVLSALAPPAVEVEADLPF